MSRSASRLASLFASVAALGLNACGGGGGGSSSAAPPPPAPASPAQGLWNGTTSSGRFVTAIVLDTGTYWVLYSVPADQSIIAGVVEGTSTASGGTFSSADGKDFNLEGSGISNVTVSNGTYTAQQGLSGTINYTASGQTVIFATAYSGVYDLAPSLTELAGNYTGNAASPGSGFPNTPFNITAAGAVSGSIASQCSFTGTAAPHAAGNIYDLTINFSGTACALGTITGVIYYDATTKRINAAALNSGRTNGMIYVGTKP